MTFHAVMVFGLSKNILFKSVLGHCDCVMGIKMFFYLFCASASKSKRKKSGSYNIIILPFLVLKKKSIIVALSA